MSYIDTHTHLMCDELFENAIQILDELETHHVTNILVICLSFIEYERAKSLKVNYPFIDIAYGIHPESANDYTSSDYQTLLKICEERQIVAIGEIGLDYYWVKDNKQQQQELFIRQLQLAAQYNLPVIIHCRDASEDTFQLLSANDVPKKGIMHCFSGSVEMMERFVKLGYSISLAGVVTFKNAKVSKEVAIRTPLDFLFYETDSPYLTPEPFRGKQNDPRLVGYVARYIANLRDISEEQLSQQIVNNYQAMFHKE
jgi:TatD DNase family protein